MLVVVLLCLLLGGLCGGLLGGLLSLLLGLLLGDCGHAGADLLLGSKTGGLTDIGALGAALTDLLEAQTGKALLGLDDLACLSLDDLLGLALAVLLSVEEGPRALTGVALADELGDALVAVEDEATCITTDKLDASAGVYLEAAERANLCPIIIIITIIIIKITTTLKS